MLHREVTENHQLLVMLQPCREQKFPSLRVLWHVQCNTMALYHYTIAPYMVAGLGKEQVNLSWYYW